MQLILLRYVMNRSEETLDIQSISGQCYGAFITGIKFT